MLRSQSEARIKLNVQETCRASRVELMCKRLPSAYHVGLQEEEHDDDDDDLDEELDDEVSHRKQIKYNSERVEQQQQIRNKRKAKGKKKDT